MSFEPSDTLDAIRDALQGMEPKRFVQVLIGNPPQKALPAGFTAVITMDAMRVHQLTLAAAIELHTVRVRIYRAMLEAADEDDGKLRYRIVPEVMDLLKGDFTLGGRVRAIDWGGAAGQVPEVAFEDEEVAGKRYWTAHLVLPLIVDADAAVFAA